MIVEDATLACPSGHVGNGRCCTYSDRVRHIDNSIMEARSARVEPSNNVWSLLDELRSEKIDNCESNSAERTDYEDGLELVKN